MYTHNYAQQDCSTKISTASVDNGPDHIYMGINDDDDLGDLSNSLNQLLSANTHVVPASNDGTDPSYKHYSASDTPALLPPSYDHGYALPDSYSSHDDLGDLSAGLDIDLPPQHNPFFENQSPGPRSGYTIHNPSDLLLTDHAALSDDEHAGPIEPIPVSPAIRIPSEPVSTYALSSLMKSSFKSNIDLSPNDIMYTNNGIESSPLFQRSINRRPVSFPRGELPSNALPLDTHASPTPHKRFGCGQFDPIVNRESQPANGYSQPNSGNMNGHTNYAANDYRDHGSSANETASNGYSDLDDLDLDLLLSPENNLHFNNPAGRPLNETKSLVDRNHRATTAHDDLFFKQSGSDHAVGRLRADQSDILDPFGAMALNVNTANPPNQVCITTNSPNHHDENHPFSSSSHTNQLALNHPDENHPFSSSSHNNQLALNQQDENRPFSSSSRSNQFALPGDDLFRQSTSNGGTDNRWGSANNYVHSGTMRLDEITKPVVDFESQDHVPRVYHTIQLQTLANDLKTQAQEHSKELARAHAEYHDKLARLKDRIMTLEADLDQANHQLTSVAELRRTFEDEKQLEVSRVERLARAKYDTCLKQIRDQVLLQQQADPAVKSHIDSDPPPIKSDASTQCATLKTEQTHSGTQTVDDLAVDAERRRWQHAFDPILLEHHDDQIREGDPTKYASQIQMILTRLSGETGRTEQSYTDSSQQTEERALGPSQADLEHKISDLESAHTRELEHIAMKWQVWQDAIREECKDVIGSTVSAMRDEMDAARAQAQRFRADAVQAQADIQVVKDRARAAILKIRTQYSDRLREFKHKVVANQQDLARPKKKGGT